jgi:hypothetical protein
LLELLHPTAPSSNPSNSTAEPSAHSLVRRNMLFWFRSTRKTSPSKPIPRIDAGIMYPLGGTYVLPTAIVNFELAAEPPGVIVEGENAHVTPDGKPVHERLIGLLKPPAAAASMVTLVEPPRVTVADVAESISEKLLGAVAAGTRVANSPCVCEALPAVK